MDLNSFKPASVSQVLQNEFWTHEVESQITRVFFIGYLAGHVPSGIMADIYGAKWVLNIGIFLSAIFTLIMPVMAKMGGTPAIIAVRIFTGLAQSAVFPACSALMARWAPQNERSSLGAIVMSGGLFGQVLSSLISSYLIAYVRWEAVFYVWGLSGVIWSLFFAVMCFSDPHKHPCISETELEKFELEFGIVKTPKLKKFPWTEIFLSEIVWALIICNIGHDLSLYVMLTDLPIYMRDVLHMTVVQTGLVGSIKFLGFWISSVASGFIADALIRSGKMKMTTVRKVNTLIAHIGPGIFLIAASYVGCDEVVVVSLFTIALILMGPYYSGMKLTPLDVSPNYAGTLMALANGAGSLCGYISPTLVRLMTPNATLNEWRGVFQLAFAVLCSTGIVFSLWGTSDIQPWNEVRDDDVEENKR